MSDLRKASKYAVQRKRHSIWRNVVTGIAAVVVFCTTYALILPAITMESEPTYCGFEDHEHTEECYELVCGVDEFVPHYHTDECYMNAEGNIDRDNGPFCHKEETTVHVHSDGCKVVLTCELEEYDPHPQHTDECYGLHPVLICEEQETAAHAHDENCYVQGYTCGLAESEGHTHGGECYDESGELVCTVEESDGHTHSDACLGQVLSCGLEETDGHNHDDACYEEQNGLICTSPVGEGHTHDSDCYETHDTFQCGHPEGKVVHQHNTNCYRLICEEHVHTEECYVKPEDAPAPNAQLRAAPANDPTVRDLLLEVFTEEELQEICDTYPEYTLEDIWALLNTPMTLDAAPVDFSNYINNLKVEKIVNGDWTPASEFEDGDRIRVSIDYTIPDNTLVGGVDTICYQLPVPGVRPNAGLGGKVKDKNTKQDIGDYTISETGVITIKFDSSFIADGKSFPAEISFEGEADLNEGDGPRDFTFPGTGTTINVKPGGNNNTNKDSSVTKTHEEYSNGVIWYEVAVTTEKGSPNPLALWDTLQGASYNENSVEINKGGQKLEGNAYSVAFRTDGGGNKMDITGLPELKDSTESYTVRYSVTPNEQLPDGTWLVNNTIMTNSYTSSSDNYELSKSRIGKTGSYDQDTGLLRWEVTVNENGGPIKDWKLNDTLDEGLEIVGSIQVQHYDGYWQDITGITPTINNAKNGFEYTFQDGASGGYKFIYYSTAPTTDGTAAKNTAVFKDPNNNPYTAEINPTVNLRKEGVSKSAEQSDAVQINESTRKNVWKTNLTLAEKKFKSYEAFTYTDTILAPSSPAGAKHYGVKSEIEAAIRQSIKFDYYVRDVRQYESLSGASAFAYFELEVTCYPEAGGVAVTDDTTPVTYFEVTVKPRTTVADTLFGKSIEFKYPTYVTFEGLQSGETVKSENEGTFGDLKVNADQSYTKSRRLEKGVVIDPNDSTNGYTSADWTTEYTENKVIKYRLTLRPELSENGPITLVDTLPKGVVFGGLTNWELHRTDNWGNTHEYLYDYNSQSGYSFDFSKPSGGDRPQCSTSEDDKGQTVVTITIPGGYNNPEQFGQTRTSPNALVLEYTVTVTDEIWSGDAEYTTTLENTLIGMDAQTSHSTTVERIPDTLSKFVEQVEDGGDPTNRLHYCIIINPLAEDLDLDSDKVKLVDTLSGNNFNAASLLMDSVELYTYDPSAQDKHGSLVDPGMYDVVYNDTNKTQPTFEITFNDSQALVLEYDYLIDQGQKADAPEVSNIASLCGHDASTDRLKLKTNSSSAGAGKAVFYFYKVDAANYTHLLDGAEFRIREYPAGEWKSVDAKDGKLKIEAESGSSNTEGYVQINPDTLYELEETKAPDGYRKGESLLFVWLKNKTVAEIASASGVGQDKIHAFGKDGGTINIPNESTSIYVKKVWQDSKGNAVNPVSPVKVQLVRRTEKLDTKTVTVHLGYSYIETWNSYNYVEQFNSPVSYVVATNTEFKICFGCNANTNIEYWVDDGTRSTLEANDSATISYGQITDDCDVYLLKSSGEYYNVEYLYDSPNPQSSILGSWENSGNPIELPYNGAWEYRWKDLPVDDGNGTEYYYSVVESDPENPTDWTVSYNINNGRIQSGDITIINTVPDVPRTFINLEKHWKEYDSTGALVDLTPDDSFTATFKLYKREAGSTEQGTQVGEDITLTNNKWTWKSNYLPIKEDGKTLEYYFEEVSANGFTHGDPDVSTDKTSYSFTNVRASKTPIEVQKSWINNDSGNVETVSFNLFQRTWDHAPTEVDLSAPDLTHESFGSASAYAVDGQKAFDLTAGNQWKYTFDDLPTTGTAEDGSTVYYSYYVVEDPNGAYKILSSGGEVVPASPAPQITVTNTSLTSINVQKQWKNWKGEPMTENYPLSSVEVAVFYTLTGETEEHSYVPVDATGWNDTTVDNVIYKTRTVQSDGTLVEITGLPKYMNNSSGTPVLVNYTAREVGVNSDLYSVTQSGTGTSADPIVITNTQKMKIKVQKAWAEGDKPDDGWSVGLKLVRKTEAESEFNPVVREDGSEYVVVVYSSDTDGVEISDLDYAKEDGTPYIYRLEETYVKLTPEGENSIGQYETPEVNPTEGTDGYTITATNTRKPSYELPHTGGAGTSLYTMAGLAISIGALGGLLMKTKRKKGEAD